MDAPKHKLTYILPNEARTHVSVVGVCVFATSVTMMIVIAYFMFGGSNA